MFRIFLWSAERLSLCFRLLLDCLFSLLCVNLRFKQAVCAEDRILCVSRLCFTFFWCSQGERVGDFAKTGAEFDCPAGVGGRDACESAVDRRILTPSQQKHK